MPLSMLTAEGPPPVSAWSCKRSSPDMPQTHPSLALTYCTQCKPFFPLAPHACRNGGSTALDTRPASGTGVVRSVTQVYRAPSPAWQEKAPYALALVRLSEGPSLMTHVPLDTQVGAEIQLENTTTS